MLIGSFIPSWQLFLSDSISIDKALQASVEHGVRHLVPLGKGSSSSRLSFFVSLSNRGTPECESKDGSEEKKKTSEKDTSADTVLKFKSVLLSTATLGLTLHPISSYYPLSNTTPAPSRPISPHTTQTPAHGALNAQNTPYRPNNKQEVTARKKAIQVLESMVQGLDLKKWFLSGPSITSQSRGGGGSKVIYTDHLLLSSIFIFSSPIISTDFNIYPFSLPFHPSRASLSPDLLCSMYIV